VLSTPVVAQSRLTGIVFDSLLTSRPLPGATVSVLGTTHVTTADGAGRFRIDGIPAGSYRVAFFHPSLDSLGIAPPVADVRAPETGEASIVLATPSAATIRTLLCPDVRDSSTGVVIGRVRDVDTRAPLPDAEVSSVWLELVFGAGGIASEPQRQATRSTSAGVFALCGIPIDIPVFVRARSGDQTSGPIEVYAANRQVVFQHFAVSLRDSSARASVDSLFDSRAADSLTRPPGLARLVGRVRDGGGRPVKGARVRVLRSGEVAVTNDTGVFRLGQLPGGTQTVEVRALGFAPRRVAIDLPSAEPAEALVTLDRNASELPNVRVLGRTVRARSGFEERRRRGLGYFLDAERIDRMGGSTAMDLLFRAPGLTTRYVRSPTGGLVRRVTMRGMLSVRNPSGHCIPNLYIDGMVWQEAWDELDTFFLKQDVVGIEVYQGYGSIPAQFDRANGCGSVVMWTRR
jgi:hypothetical protein